jgi:hypothetical protein
MWNFGSNRVDQRDDRQHRDRGVFRKADRFIVGPTHIPRISFASVRPGPKQRIGRGEREIALQEPLAVATAKLEIMLGGLSP